MYCTSQIVWRCIKIWYIIRLSHHRLPVDDTRSPHTQYTKQETYWYAPDAFLYNQAYRSKQELSHNCLNPWSRFCTPNKSVGSMFYFLTRNTLHSWEHRIQHWQWVWNGRKVGVGRIDFPAGAQSANDDRVFRTVSVKLIRRLGLGGGFLDVATQTGHWEVTALGRGYAVTGGRRCPDSVHIRRRLTRLRDRGCRRRYQHLAHITNTAAVQCMPDCEKVLFNSSEINVTLIIRKVVFRKWM